jgi:hypothetical protein
MRTASVTRRLPLYIYSQAEAMCKDLERGFEAVKKKFAGVLAYFGEDGGMSSTDFFTTLHKFVLVSIRRFCG